MRNLLLITLVTTAIGTTSALADSTPFPWKSYGVLEEDTVSEINLELSAVSKAPSIDTPLPLSIALNAWQAQQILSERDKYLTTGKTAGNFRNSYKGMGDLSWESPTQSESNPQKAFGYEALTAGLSAAQVQQILSERDKYLVK